MMGAVASLSIHAPLPGAPGPGPSGDPSLATIYSYGGNLVGLQWTNGDVTAQTQVGYNAVQAEPSGVYDIVPPGVTTYETGTTDEQYWWVRHLKNGQTGAWVQVLVEE